MKVEGGDGVGEKVGERQDGVEDDNKADLDMIFHNVGHQGLGALFAMSITHRSLSLERFAS